MTDKTLVGELKLLEHVKRDDGIYKEETGRIEVYDDFTVNWEYDGRHLPHVRKTIYKWKDVGERDIVTGGSSIESGQDEVVEGTADAYIRFSHLENRLKKKNGSGWKSMLYVERV